MWIVGGGIVMPIVLLIGVFAHTLVTMRAISPAPAAEQMVIELVGNQWWWEVRYPTQQVTTANEIHIPTGRPVELRLTSEDVIHSFWVPELHGKIDLIPGRTTSLVLQADQPGEYRGQCAEFCGVQHAKMALIVVSETPEQFSAWLEAKARPAAEPSDPAALESKQVFLGSACAYCHTIQGTDATGKVGLDLTHLASRRTLASATLTNTRDHLAAWITDPQKIKPGNIMPAIDLAPDDLEALLTYLENLK